MKAFNIHFFSPTENAQPNSKNAKAAKPVEVNLTGYISTVGKLVLPAKTVANLGIDLDTTRFKVGMDQGKHKAKSLYLVPADNSPYTFGFEKGAKSYSLGLLFILRKSRINFEKTKYSFTIRLFEYEGVRAFELPLTPESAAKVPYTGKPRGRKPRQEPATQLV